jgi:hypothetical protein
VDGKPLVPHRADTTRVNDAIITEIVTGIGNDLVVLADLTTIGMIDGFPQRNANVLYEVGIAQAVRLAEEVLLFRSDSDRFAFDMAGVRVHTYDPDTKPKEAQSLVAESIRGENAQALADVLLATGT